MNNYAAVIEYDGTDFKGFQAQPRGLRTVQGELQKALKAVGCDFHDFSYAGRTDAGVHATGQVIGFRAEKLLDLYRFKWKLNCVLPEDIVLKEINKVSAAFDARKDAVMRQYSYHVVNSNWQSVFLKKYSIMITRKLDLERMRKTAEKFIGIKDFSAFCSNGSHAGYTFKQVYDLKIKKFPGELLIFRIAADSFLYNMARIIVGTLIEVGSYKRDIESIDLAFRSRNRKDAGTMVASKGLFLTKVVYKKNNKESIYS